MFPELIEYKSTPDFAYMIMECLGNNLEELISK